MIVKIQKHMCKGMYPKSRRRRLPSLIKYAHKLVVLECFTVSRLTRVSLGKLRVSELHWWVLYMPLLFFCIILGRLELGLLFNMHFGERVLVYIWSKYELFSSISQYARVKFKSLSRF